MSPPTDCRRSAHCPHRPILAALCLTPIGGTLPSPDLRLTRNQPLAGTLASPEPSALVHLADQLEALPALARSPVQETRTAQLSAPPADIPPEDSIGLNRLDTCGSGESIGSISAERCPPGTSSKRPFQLKKSSRPTSRECQHDNESEGRHGSTHQLTQLSTPRSRATPPSPIQLP